jgi:hypothetical protein
VTDTGESGSGSRGSAWSSGKSILRIIRDNLVNSATVSVALYAFIRGLVTPYTAKDIAFLLSTIVGLLGLNALDGFIERRVQLKGIETTIRRASSSAIKIEVDMAHVRGDLTTLALAVSGLRLGASATQLLIERPEVPRDRLRHAKCICWTGVTLRTSLRQRLTDLRTALEHNASLTILMIDPSNYVLKNELCLREGVRYEYIDAVLTSTILNLQLLADSPPEGISYSLGWHRYFPTCGLLIIDPDDGDGICYVEPYHADRSKETTFIVHATTDAAWFRFFMDQFHAMRQRAEVYKVTGPADVEEAAQRGADAKQGQT